MLSDQLGEMGGEGFFWVTCECWRDEMRKWKDLNNVFIRVCLVC